MEAYMPCNFFWVLVFVFSIGVCTRAQIVEQYNPPPSRCCLATAAKTLADAMQDWNQMGRYYAADQELEKQPADPKRVVFMGASIVDFWHLADSFPGKPYVNRGISGQVTSQMLSRMFQDVIDLKPAVVVILAGTNDIAQNNGPETATMVEENFMAITELAQKHGIKVVLCSITPTNDYTMMPVGGGGLNALPPGSAPAKHIQSVQHPPADILKLNAWLKDYAATVGAVYADYYSAVVDPNGMFKEGYSNDGLHPNAQGYGLMAPVAKTSIEKALQ
jgi:lysophospholipase L1-like esterase